ncbi:MAG: hypothetical protein J6P64_06345 [Bacteroidales bacterium]|nr:hypothetical protein [Bacteroidales bacterium]
MKTNPMTSPWLLLTGMTMLIVASCNTQRNEQFDQQTLVVERQKTQLNDSGYELGAEVDFPVAGTQPLVDSVKRFITQELYLLFDSDYDEETIHIPFETVCKWNNDKIVTAFHDNYKPLYRKYGADYGADYLSLTLTAQTENLVTYYGEYTSCGASCCTGYGYYTFRISDGHLLQEVIDEEGLEAFVKEHPQYEQLLYDADEKYFGMLEDELLYVYRFYGVAGGVTDKTAIPYIEIAPFLNREAKDLIVNHY